MPVILVEADDRTALEIAIVENVQRADLNALEEAAGYDQLMGEFGYSQGDLAKVIGKSRSHVANTLRLMKLPDGVRGLLAGGQLSAGHARALLAVGDPDSVARRILDEGWTVRDVERQAQKEAAGEQPAAKGKPKVEKDPDTRALEKVLEDVLGLKVSIDHKPSGGGKVSIAYQTLEQLEGLCRRLKE